MNDYWGKRLADKAYNHGTEEMLRKLRKIYKDQSKGIQGKVIDLYIKMLEEGEISTTNLYAYGRYTELLREINKILVSSGEKEEQVIYKGLEKAYKSAFGKTTEALGKSVKWGLENTYVMEETVNANFKGANWSKRIWKNRDELAKKLEKCIQNTVASGTSKDKAVKKIMEVEKTSFSNADRLVRTETVRVINDGQKASYKANGYTHGFYIVAEDDRLCKECSRIAKESEINPIPLDEMEGVHHPNCRCTIKPVAVAKPVLYAKEAGEKPEQNKPAFVENIDITKPNVVKSKLREYENKIVNEPVEHAYCILSNGEVYKFKGDKTSVNPMALGDKLKGAVITHNHPKEETQYSFSDYDVGLFLENGIKALRGCDNKYIYEITSTEKTLRASTDMVIYEFGGELYKEALQIVYDKGLNFDEDLVHTEIEFLAKKYNFKYKREKR